MTVDTVPGMCPGVSQACRTCSETGYTEQKFVSHLEVERLINITKDIDSPWSRNREEILNKTNEFECRISCQGRNYCKGYNFVDDAENNCKLLIVNLKLSTTGDESLWRFKETNFGTNSQGS